ncbi:unnamed protein product [Trichogramma brassicae]|uniref:Uncharacterized protein n=1 Tax=Trichogramma brassicae TaxID=86971 RepID=A0A6H5I3V8_9HYME|nr:unnamed protein product [Trichogramma brassicae]
MRVFSRAYAADPIRFLTLDSIRLQSKVRLKFNKHYAVYISPFIKNKIIISLNALKYLYLNKMNLAIRPHYSIPKSPNNHIRERTYEQRREWKICLESERSSSVRAERDILGDVYVGLTSTARVVRSYVARVKSASAGTSRPECAKENQSIQRPSRPQGQPRVELDQEKISTSCGESGGPAFGRCICESYAPTRPPGLRSSRLPSTGYSGTLGGRVECL